MRTVELLQQAAALGITPLQVDILIGTGENGRMLGLLNDPGCAVTRGSSYLNEANLSPTFFTHITRQYRGTRIGAFGITPLEVMIENMRTLYAAGDLAGSHEAAKDRAPYMHPRLNSIDARVEQHTTQTSAAVGASPFSIGATS